MRFKLTKYGWPQVVVFPAIITAAMIVSLVVGRLFLPGWSLISALILLAIALIWSLAFFRDPYRLGPLDKKILLAPADGRITDIETIEENDFIGSSALRIGIFLNIFDAHINRAPCNVIVEKITYRPGKHKNAAKPASGRVNESNDLYLVRTDSPEDKLIVRQISGAIARRIVCRTSQGRKLSSGEKFGMIKFGSRTELYVPARPSSSAEHDAYREKKNTQHATRNTQYEIKCLVKTGDKVKAGLTPIVKYEIRDTKQIQMTKIQNLKRNRMF